MTIYKYFERSTPHQWLHIQALIHRASITRNCSHTEAAFVPAIEGKHSFKYHAFLEAYRAQIFQAKRQNSY